MDAGAVVPEDSDSNLGKYQNQHTLGNGNDIQQEFHEHKSHTAEQI
jgi:hypothetical protein